MTTKSRRKAIPKEQIEAAEKEIVERSRRIDFYPTEYTIELLVDKYHKKDFEIPDYQREDTWGNPRKSRFIESIHMGLPVPFLFFWEMPDGKLEIVDGSQRIRTLYQYIKESLILGSLEALPSLKGTTFGDLAGSRQRKFLNKSIRGVVLNEHADLQARFDMFDRINTGSKVANTAEVRRGALRGQFQELVEGLAKLPLFTELAPMVQKATDERIGEELVSRFFAYGDGLDSYRENPAGFIFEYTKIMNERFSQTPTLINEYRNRFTNMLTFVRKTFPYGFRKSDHANSTPRVRFEAIAIGSYWALQENPNLANDPVPDISGWIDGADFKKFTTSDAANVKSRLVNRIEFVRDKLLGK
jgi:hypothetical protein